MKYTIEITQHTTVDALEQKQVYGEQMEEICKIFGIAPHEDWQNKKYIYMNIPEKKTINAVIFKQGLEELDLGALILLVNKKEV